VNYYRRFISGYSNRAAPLTDLLKKDRPWAWTKKCLEAKEDLKAAVASDPRDSKETCSDSHREREQGS
jgi:hypothetical protein